jgi:hypothetical protein
MDNTKLSNCPFCGGPARYLPHNPGMHEEYAICDRCEFRLSPAAWNRRAIEQVKAPSVYWQGERVTTTTRLIEIVKEWASKGYDQGETDAIAASRATDAPAQGEQMPAAIERYNWTPVGMARDDKGGEFILYHQGRAALAASPVAADKPVAWIRFRSDGGYEGPIMDVAMEDVRKRSGAWTPLVAAPVAASTDASTESTHRPNVSNSAAGIDGSADAAPAGAVDEIADDLARIASSLWHSGMANTLADEIDQIVLRLKEAAEVTPAPQSSDKAASEQGAGCSEAAPATAAGSVPDGGAA